MELFMNFREDVKKHNAMPGITWKAAVNHFADFTPAEFEAMLGHRPARRYRSGSPQVSSLLEMQARNEVAESIDWRQKVNGSEAAAKSQGSCGSCWAVSTVGALEIHAAVATGASVPEISFEELVDCVPNPQECG